MRIALITDSHFGARGDSPHFNDYFFKFWEQTFFPYIEKHDIKHIIHLGDVVDRRKFINFSILNSVRNRFIKRLEKLDCTMDVLVGNHDVPYRNTNEVNAVNELFGKHDWIRTWSEPTEVVFDNTTIAYIPWINASNYQQTLEFIRNSKAKIAMGHLEISGFEMDRGNICTTGMRREEFEKFDTVYTGHFHHRSTDGHIFYLGNTYEITWADYGDMRGFHIFDTDTSEVEFIENPHRMFHKLVYDDSIETWDSVNNYDFNELRNRIVKVVVGNKDNPVLFEKFMERLYKVEPLDVTIVEDFTDYSELSESDVINQADSTTEILDKYVDSIEVGVDKDRMKNVLRNIYNEALTQENT